MSDIQTKADARIIDLLHHIDEHIRFVLQHVFNTKLEVRGLIAQEGLPEQGAFFGLPAFKIDEWQPAIVYDHAGDAERRGNLIGFI